MDSVYMGLIVGSSLAIGVLFGWIQSLRQTQAHLREGNKAVLDLCLLIRDTLAEDRAHYENRINEQHQFILECQGLIQEKNEALGESKQQISQLRGQIDSLSHLHYN